MDMLENSIAPPMPEMAEEEIDSSDMLSQVLAAIKGQSGDAPMINIFILSSDKEKESEEETNDETYVGGALPLSDGSLNFGGM